MSDRAKRILLDRADRAAKRSLPPLKARLEKYMRMVEDPKVSPEDLVREMEKDAEQDEARN